MTTKAAGTVRSPNRIKKPDSNESYKVTKERKKDMSFENLHPHPKFAKWCEGLLFPVGEEPRIELSRKNKPEQKKFIVRVLLNTLISGLSRNKRFYVSRNTKDGKWKVRVFDRLQELDLIRVVEKGKQKQGCTRYACGARLIRCFEKVWAEVPLIDTRLKRLDEGFTTSEATLIRIQNKQKGSSPVYLPVPASEQAKVSRVESSLEDINNFNSSFCWSMPVSFNIDGENHIYSLKLEPRLCQIHSKICFRCPRFYGVGRMAIMNLRSDQRQYIRIDGAKTIELDFKSMAMRLAYHEAKIDPEDKDLYSPRRFMGEYANTFDRSLLRSFIKKVCMIAFNNDGEQAVLNSLDRLITKSKWETRGLEHVLNDAGLHTPKRLLKRVMECHPQIKHLIGTQEFTRLQEFDARIIFRILIAATAEKIPAYSIHDSVICRKKDQERVLELMNQKYFESTGFSPVIDAK